MAAEPQPEAVSHWAAALGGAGVAWLTVDQLAVAVRLAGVPGVRALGREVIEGDPAVAELVLRLLEEIAPDPAPAERLAVIARLMRFLSIPTVRSAA